MTHSTQRLHVLCLSGKVKGYELIRELQRAGCEVTVVSLVEHDPDWPRDLITRFIPVSTFPTESELIRIVAHELGAHPIDWVIPLQERTMELGAALREHLGLDGMDGRAIKLLRDKLTMRRAVRRARLPQPEFAPTFHDQQVKEFMERVPAPWILKPRNRFEAEGVIRCDTPDAVWSALQDAGDWRAYYMIEQFVSGSMTQIDSIVWDGQVLLSRASALDISPLDFYRGGTMWVCRNIPPGTDARVKIEKLNSQLVSALGPWRGVTHTEIMLPDGGGPPMFIESAARVGGGATGELIEAATGLNLWREWAHIELAWMRGDEYKLPEHRADLLGAVIGCRSRYEQSDYSSYTEPEIFWRATDPHLAGIVVATPDAERLQELVKNIHDRMQNDFLARDWDGSRLPDAPLRK